MNQLGPVHDEKDVVCEFCVCQVQGSSREKIDTLFAQNKRLDPHSGVCLSDAAITNATGRKSTFSIVYFGVLFDLSFG